MTLVADETAAFSQEMMHAAPGSNRQQLKENSMAKPCEHLQNLTAADFPPPRTSGASEECLREGTRWVELWTFMEAFTAD